MLSIKDLHVSVEDKAILRGLSLDVRPGEVHAIMGPNGSGKSTLSATLAGREDYEVTSGTVEFKGKDLLALSPEDRAGEGIFMALSAEEQQNVQTMPYTLPAGFTQFKDNKAVDQKLVDKALYRRAGYPVAVSSGATPAASNAPSVESAQNGEPEQGNMLRATQ